MGIQTFNDTTLRLLHRRHTAQQAIDAFERCRQAGFANISIDLMYGLPGETLASWKADLEQAIALHPEHISAYHLIYEEGTPLWKLREEHRVSEIDEDLSVSLFSELIHTLKPPDMNIMRFPTSACPENIRAIIPAIGLERNTWAAVLRLIRTTASRANGTSHRLKIHDRHRAP